MCVVRAWCVCVCVWCVCVWCSCAPFRARRQRRPLQAATKRRPPALVACGDGATSQSLERRCTDVHAHWLPTAATWSRTRLTARWHRSPRARHRITALVCPRPEHKKNCVARASDKHCICQTAAAGLVRCGQVRCVRAACARSGPRVPYAARNFLCRVIDSLTTVVRMQPNKPPLGGEVGGGKRH